MPYYGIMNIDGCLQGQNMPYVVSQNKAGFGNKTNYLHYDNMPQPQKKIKENENVIQ